MANATPVKALAAGTSLTKAGQGFGLRQQQQCVRMAIWSNKHAVAGCLA
jgi:hypothetical protein